ncbi:MAG TPA: trimethylamine methyltransferase family protein [Candidatus Bathyarchaeia archaeon]|nr:trimethylamine methyltransferase family protein [Candidatus Bathyarchaeia archaeon]
MPKAPSAVRPTLQLLSTNDIENIHNASLMILEKTGVVVKNNEALNLLKNSGCSVNLGKKTVHVPQSLVKESLRKTRSLIRLYSRDGKNELEIGGNSTVFNPGSSAVYFSDHATGEIRQPFSKDLVQLVRLVDGLEHIQAQSTAMVPSEVPEELGDLYRLYLVLKNSTKPMITGAFTKQGLLDMKRLLETIVGKNKLAAKPLAIFDCCPSSPLMWSDTTCQNLIDCAKFGLPAEIIPAPQMGATSPVTLAGTLVQFNAEFLSGLVISQAVKSGAPVIYGGSPTTFDMKYLSSRLGSIENMMTACAAAQIAKHYGLPSHAYLGLSDSKIIDTQCGIESGAGAILGALAGVNVISGPGMLVFENCQSLEKLIIDNEICGMALRLVEGINATSETLAFDVISKVGPGGHYLGEAHTLKWFEKEQLMPSDVIDRSTLEATRKQKPKEMVARAREAVDKILKDHIPEPLLPDVENDLREALNEIMTRYKIKSLPVL